MQGRRLPEIQVDSGAKVYSCTPAATLEEAMQKMQEAQVRRLPIVDEGRAPSWNDFGMISLADIARQAPGACDRRRDVRSHH
jgi:CBS-domain-containing membrane protein